MAALMMTNATNSRRNQRGGSSSERRETNNGGLGSNSLQDGERLDLRLTRRAVRSMWRRWSGGRVVMVVGGLKGVSGFQEGGVNLREKLIFLRCQGVAVSCGGCSGVFVEFEQSGQQLRHDSDSAGVGFCLIAIAVNGGSVAECVLNFPCFAAV